MNMNKSNRRLAVDEAAPMLRETGTAELMTRADQLRRNLHGRKTYFVHSLNLNPTNICGNKCNLCAFWRAPDAPDSYIIDLAEARQILLSVQDRGLTDLHIVGGLTPELGLAYYESLIGLARELLPSVLVQGMTAVEIHYLAGREDMPVEDVLHRLIDAGLGAIPGGGAEIFDAGIRAQICENKISAEQWLAVHEQAHRLDLPTNATMLFGHIETLEQIVDHLARLRDLQDRTGGFKAFVALPFHTAGTNLAVSRGPGAHTVARTVALARLFLDNIPHVRVLANYMDLKLLHILTHAGADDVGGTSIDERIARAAGAPPDHRFTSIQQVAGLLTELDLEPVLVNSAYEEKASETLCPATARARPGHEPGACDVLARIQDKGGRLSAGDAVILHDNIPFHQLGLLAHRRRMEQVPGDRVTFVLDRIISITNVCEAGCAFCAFHVKPGHDNGFTLSIEHIIDKVAAAVDCGATQIMLQGGLNPALDLAFYEKMLSSIKRHADVWLHSLSPPEISYLADRSGLSVRDVLARLMDAGLDSLPGGGAEILVDEIRQNVSPGKITAGQWLDVMETAHVMGLKGSATMVYGLGETTAQRVEHLVRIRDLQDRTGGFVAFIPWSFQSNRTQLALPGQTGVDYLRMVALGRLVLDNVPHVQAGWVTEGPGLAQLALSFGADDFGGVLMEEQVLRATGVSHSVTAEDVISLIHEAGFIAAQRNTEYGVLRTFVSRKSRNGHNRP